MAPVLSDRTLVAPYTRFAVLLTTLALLGCSKRSAPTGASPGTNLTPPTSVTQGDAGKTAEFEPPTEAAMDPDHLPWHGEALRAAVTEVSSANYKRELDRLEAEISPDSGKP